MAYRPKHSNIMPLLWSDRHSATDYYRKSIEKFRQGKDIARIALCPCRAQKQIADLERTNKVHETIIQNGVVHIDHDPNNYLPMLVKKSCLEKMLNFWYSLPREDHMYLYEGEKIELSDEAFASLREAYIPQWDQHKDPESVEDFVKTWYEKNFPAKHFRYQLLSEALPAYLTGHQIGFSFEMCSVLAEHIEENVKFPLKRPAYDVVQDIADEYLRGLSIPVFYEDEEVFDINPRDHSAQTIGDIIDAACTIQGGGLNSDHIYLKYYADPCIEGEPMLCLHHQDEEFGNYLEDIVWGVGEFRMLPTLQVNAVVRDFHVTNTFYLSRVLPEFNVDRVIAQFLCLHGGFRLPSHLNDLNKIVRVELNGQPVDLDSNTEDLDYDPSMTFVITQISKSCWVRVTVANMSPRTFQMTNIDPMWRLCRFKEAALNRFFERMGERVNRNDFRVGFCSGDLLDNESVLMMDLDYDDHTCFDIMPRGLGGARRPRQDRQDQVNEALANISPDNPFLHTMQTFHGMVSNNTPNILQHFINHMSYEQISALSETWNGSSQNDPQRIVMEIWGHMHSDFEAIRQMERYVASAKRVITLLLETVYVRELTRGENIAHRQMTSIINDRYDMLHQQFVEQQQRDEMNRLVELARQQGRQDALNESRASSSHDVRIPDADNDSDPDL